MRTAEGAARYGLPIGSIIVGRDRKGRELNFSDYDDDHLIELMGSAAAQDKNPNVYEAAYTEWARRQPVIEPDLDYDPDMAEEVDVTRTDQLDMLGAERDRAFDELQSGLIEDDAEWQNVYDRWQVYDGLVEHEQRLAATRTPQDAGAGELVTADDDEDAQQAAYEAFIGDLADDPPVVEVKISEARQRQWDLMEQAEEKAEAEGISYEEALGQLQGLDAEQVHRREFVRQAQAAGYSETSFDRLLSRVHHDCEQAWGLDLEEATRGQDLQKRWRDKPGFIEEWNNNGMSWWSMNDRTARQYMSDEAAAWFDTNGRITKSDLRGMIEVGIVQGYDPDTIRATYQTWAGRRLGGDYLA